MSGFIDTIHLEIAKTLPSPPTITTARSTRLLALDDQAGLSGRGDELIYLPKSHLFGELTVGPKDPHDKIIRYTDSI